MIATRRRSGRTVPALALAAASLAAAGLARADDGRNLLGHDQADTQRRVSHRIPLGTPVAAAIERLQAGGYKCYPPRDRVVVCARQSLFGFRYWSVTLTVWAGQVAGVKATTSSSFL